MSTTKVGRKPADLNGKTFGRLTILAFAGWNRFKNRVWLCHCECGKELEVTAGSLLSGCTSSCGCWAMDVLIARSTKHGMAKRQEARREHRIWCSIRQRCNNKNNRAWPAYGGRGIKVCDRWMESFENFYADMGTCPKGYSIERKDNDGNYSPDNCVWASAKVQARNKRNVPVYTFNGQTKSLPEWAEITGIHVETLRNRIRRGGWKFEDAIASTNDHRFRGKRRLSSASHPQGSSDDGT